MNLVVLTRQFGQYTGATIATSELLNRLKKNFKSVRVITLRKDNSKTSGIDFVIVKTPFEAFKKLKDISNKEDWIGYSDDHLGYLLEKAGIQFIHTYHGNWPDARKLSLEMFIKSLVLIPMYKKTVCKATLSVSVSKYMEKNFLTKISPNTTTIYNGVKESNIKMTNINNKYQNRIMMVGNVDKRKYIVALKLFEIMEKDMVNPIIDIYGKIIDKQLAQKLNMFKFVNLKGKVDNVPYEKYRCLLCTSTSENLPISIVEALRQRVAVITFDVGGCAEIINNDSGIIISKYDITGMKAAINDIFQKEFTFESFSKIEKKFEWDYIADRYFNLFRRVGELND